MIISVFAFSSIDYVDRSPGPFPYKFKPKSFFEFWVELISFNSNYLLTQQLILARHWGFKSGWKIGVNMGEKSCPLRVSISHW